MVPRSAFERSKPVVNFSAFMQMRDHDRSFHRTPGPRREPRRKVQPGADFSAIVPVSERFGFTISASASAIYTTHEFSQNTWRGVGAPTNGTSFPDTSPDAPYLTDYFVRDMTKMTKHSALGATMDYKLGPNDRLSLAFQYAFADFYSNSRTLTFFVNRVARGDFTTTSTHGSTGAGEIRQTIAAHKTGGTLYMPSLTYRHDGPVWRSEAAIGMSRAFRHNTHIDRGYFNSTQARRQNVTVSFDDITYLRPGTITVTDGATGAPVDPTRIDNYLVDTTNSNQLAGVDLRRNAFASARRDFHGRVPITLKAGMDVRYSMRDRRLDNPTWTFLGADGQPRTADNNGAIFLDEGLSQRTLPYGFPPVQWVSNQDLYDLYVTNPNHFNSDGAAHYRRNVQLSKHSEETISAAYLRGDVQFFNSRLKVVGGIRAEQTNVTGEGQLIDMTRNFLRDSSGQVMLGSNGRPLPIATTPLEAAMLTNVDGGLQAEKEYFRWFPSINAGYNLRENLIARAGYYWSVGRPDFSQYAGSLTLPDTQELPGPNNRISVNNAGIKAWTAKTMKVSLEYYFERVGLLSVTVFQRDFTNLFGTTVFHSTPAFLALYGLDSSIYGDYDVSTEYNLTDNVRMRGIDFNYKQALTFLPHWARGVQVHANASSQGMRNDSSNSFQGFIPLSANWGLSLSRPKYTLGIKWTYTGRKRLGPVAPGRSIEPGTFNWGSKRLLIDVNAEYFFYKRMAVFANFNNLHDDPVDFQIEGPSTPSHAQFSERRKYGSHWTFGIKTSF